MLSFWMLIQSKELDNESPPVPDAEPEGFAHGRLNPRHLKKNAVSADDKDGDAKNA